MIVTQNLLYFTYYHVSHFIKYRIRNSHQYRMRSFIFYLFSFTQFIVYIFKLTPTLLTILIIVFLFNIVKGISPVAI